MAANIIPQILDRDFLLKVSNFPEEIYNFDPNDHLSLLMKVLLGDSGTGQLSVVQTTASSTQDLRGIEFSDLDDIVGNILNTGRLSNEQYGIDVNPYLDQLASIDWDAINVTDSSYRERLALTLTAINLGATVLGLTLLSEAILGCKVRILEHWKYPNLMGYWFTTSPTEFSIVALTDGALTQAQIASVVDMVEFLRPTNSIVNVKSMASTYESSVTSNLNQIVADSEWFEFDKVVSVGTKLPTNKAGTKDYPTQYWIDPSNPTSAPIFAHRSASEESVDLISNISNVSAIIYPQPGDFSQVNTIYPAGVQRNVSGGVTYGPWTAVDKADSPDNFPNGKYPGDPGHYNTFSTNYAGSNSIISSLSTLQLSSGANTNLATTGVGSISLSSGGSVAFTYSGISGDNLTGCVYSGSQSASVSTNANATMLIGYNFEWSSQSAYITYLTKMVTKLNGKFNSDNSLYALPSSNSYEVINPITPKQIVTPAPFRIVGTAYGAL